MSSRNTDAIIRAQGLLTGGLALAMVIFIVALILNLMGFTGMTVGSAAMISIGFAMLFAAALLFLMAISLVDRLSASKRARALANSLTERGLEFVDQLRDPSPQVTKGNLSVADELRKWANLRDEGLVTEHEYLAARSQLLGSKAKRSA